MRRRAVVWTIYPQPIFGSLAQSFANRIHQDVAGFLFEFVMIAQPVIKKIALPIHRMFPSDELLPILDSRCHSRFTRERNNCVQMIRHKQTQAAMPDESLVIEFDGGEHRVANGRARHSVRAGRQTQLVFARRHAVMVIKNQLPSATHCGIV
jgi:hypothetical protein